ncbi:hypothetical protein F4679DRAFT_520602 [Xylaria curta]|nr:hypothetical protein F4679DRAFT_520602 [Xylaria curta]
MEIRVMPQDTASYPRDNYFLVYTDDEVPANIGKILEDAMISTKGMSITDLLKTLSRKLCSSLESADEEQDEGDDDIILTGIDSSEGSDDSDLDDYGDDDDFGLVDGSPHIARVKIRSVIFERIYKDFRAVRDAGFKVGKICGVDHRSAHSILSMSIRVGKLGLSKEIHASWNLEPSEYLVLLMKYDGEYMPFEDTMRRPVGQIPLSFRLRKCSKYRPTLAEATAAFSPARSKLYPRQPEQEPTIDENSPAGNNLLTFGIGDSIDLLLDTGFLSMMKIRKTKSVSWDEARKIHSQCTMSAWDNTESMKMPTLDPGRMGIADKNLPPMLMDDHLSSADSVSLPLVAMQFALRYLVKCTDYCMICHDRIDETFEALKPYVCGNPLCLYQYMSLGLGPSIDQEIINQEYVVDLLISFCYASLQRTTNTEVRLREFPSGLNLQVPCVRKISSMIKKGPGDIIIEKYGILLEPIDIQVSWPQRTASITNQSQLEHLDLKVGQWVVIHTEHNPDLHVFHHARIEDKQGATLQLHIASRHPVLSSSAAYGKVVTWDWDNNNTGFTTGRLVLCNQSLDDLRTDEEKAFSLHLLLSTLPSVREMKSYLMGKKSRKLVTWDRIPPAAMKLLRWIIASNRSFIVQLDDTLSKSNEINSSDVGDKRQDRSEEKVSGLDGWIQFRFAQGSPEKEARFLEALREVESPHRTILAWHGSAVGNWHSIIREGLDFKVITNGRAYGQGVYFSRSFDYSLTYSNLHGQQQEQSIWPHSFLQITQAISLNELVNQPHKFQHSVNCYVVDALHWIQCRYLFVRPKDPNVAPIESTQTSQRQEFMQDPKYTISGPSNKTVFVPEIAIPSVQQRHTSTFSVSDGPNDYDTDVEDAEDLNFLAVEGSIHARTSRLEPSKKGTSPLTLTDFRPGHLDFSKLPRFASPSYATKPAQQTIQRELQKLQKVQSTTPLHELGWYIDFDKIDNMFQLIVELHSFDPSLPLAKDMKEAGINSIVLEIRFLRGFPLTPPFVRVIKPRFLPFAHGGGGHVTTGGAMCMELLTNTGWSPVSSMESVLLQVRLAICSQEPKPARLEKARSALSQYSVQEAIDAYIRAASVHGWEVPAELKEVAM